MKTVYVAMIPSTPVGPPVSSRAWAYIHAGVAGVYESLEAAKRRVAANAPNGGWHPQWQPAEIEGYWYYCDHGVYCGMIVATFYSDKAE